MTALRSPVHAPSTRAVLEASYRAARLGIRHELVLNAASRAGQLLIEHQHAALALAIENAQDDFGLQVRTYLRLVLAEEREAARDCDMRECRRMAPTISDEEPESR